MKDYQEALNGAKKEYGQYQHEHQLVRAGDRPENEFSAGFDESVDRADLAAKNASNYQNPSQVHSLQQPETLAQVKSMYDQADGFRQGLQKSLGNTSLMTSSGTAGRKILTEDVQLLARNAKSPEDLRKALKDVKKVEVSGQQAQDIMTYHHLVNEFAPDPLRVSQNISIVDAKYGAIALDVGGLGAKNTYATSKAMASTQNLDRGIVAARGGEQALTGRVLERFTTMEDDAKKYFGKYGVDVEVRKSGDEFQLVFLNKAPPAKAIKEFSASLASDGEFPLRGSHVPAGVTVSSDRALIAEQGHEIEKATKASLAGKIPPETLRKIVIVTTAEGKSAGTASTKFFLAEGDAALTTQQRAAVKEAMVKAVRDFNKTSSKTIPVSVPVIQSQEKEPTGIDPKN
ncbi:MAG: hypothetical protein COT73_10300 [Bdellovibrio sp. CG10_big_fil_rev_8_21_14_0_10_47_8]|nr:MAG: hypothetical protein COT73_10300 [Bdellovibrio sp. CG10_big_fil_rev_8_21_14_0_10_47_8]